MEGNNLDERIAHLRDVFLENETEYYNEIKKKLINRLIIYLYNKRSGSKLAREALDLIKQIEYGEIPEDKLELVEKEIILRLAAIEDFVRERVREKLPDRNRGDFRDQTHVKTKNEETPNRRIFGAKFEKWWMGKVSHHYI